MIMLNAMCSVTVLQTTDIVLLYDHMHATL